MRFIFYWLRQGGSPRHDALNNLKSQYARYSLQLVICCSSEWGTSPTGYVVLGCVEDRACKLQENSPAVAVVDVAPYSFEGFLHTVVFRYLVYQNANIVFLQNVSVRTPSWNGLHQEQGETCQIPTKSWSRLGIDPRHEVPGLVPQAWCPRHGQPGKKNSREIKKKLLGKSLRHSCFRLINWECLGQSLSKCC